MKKATISVEEINEIRGTFIVIIDEIAFGTKEDLDKCNIRKQELEGNHGILLVESIWAYVCERKLLVSEFYCTYDSLELRRIIDSNMIQNVGNVWIVFKMMDKDTAKLPNHVMDGYGE